MGCYSVNQLLTVVSRRDFDNVFYLPFTARGENGRGMRLFMHLFTQSVFVKDSYIKCRGDQLLFLISLQFLLVRLPPIVYGL